MVASVDDDNDGLLNAPEFADFERIVRSRSVDTAGKALKVCVYLCVCSMYVCLYVHMFQLRNKTNRKRAENDAFIFRDPFTQPLNSF